MYSSGSTTYELEGEFPQGASSQSSPMWYKVPSLNQVLSGVFGYRSQSESSCRTSSSSDVEELGEFFKLSISQASFLPLQRDFLTLDLTDLSDEARKFLNYAKVRVVDGELNWKQRFGGVLGAALGASAGFFLMLIFGQKIFDFLYENGNFPDLDMETLMTLAGTALTFDAVSHTASSLVELLKDPVSSFSLRKSSFHEKGQTFLKGCIYGGSFFASFLPIYYVGYYTHFSNWFIYLASPSFLLNVTLHFGDHLSHPVEHWFTHYCFHNELEKNKRQEYLATFKNLKRLIYELKGEELSNLYADVFKQGMDATNNIAGQDIQDLNIKESLRILQVFKIFHDEHASNLTQQDPSSFKIKKNISSWLGWGMTFLAIPGRHLVFWHIIDEIFKKLHFSDAMRDPLAIILGGLLAGSIQGLMEQEAISEKIYELLCGKKIPSGSSHYPLRLVTKAWNYITGIGAITPYMIAGMSALDDKILHPNWPFWLKIACLAPFGIADAFNRASMFHESTFNLMNTFDSCVSYCYAFQGYKRDKLIRMTRQFHKLFKELRTDVLEDIDRLLNNAFASDLSSTSTQSSDGQTKDDDIVNVDEGNREAL